jgi:hypothetical protein
MGLSEAFGNRLSRVLAPDCFKYTSVYGRLSVKRISLPPEPKGLKINTAKDVVYASVQIFIQIFSLTALSCWATIRNARRPHM